MISGSEVIDPCPISVAADMMVIVPSRRDADPWAQRLAGPLAGEHRGIGAADERNGKRQTGGADHHLAAGRAQTF